MISSHFPLHRLYLFPRPAKADSIIGPHAKRQRHRKRVDSSNNNITLIPISLLIDKHPAADSTWNPGIIRGRLLFRASGDAVPSCLDARNWPAARHTRPLSLLLFVRSNIGLPLAHPPTFRPHIIAHCSAAHALSVDSSHCRRAPTRYCAHAARKASPRSPGPAI